MLSTTPNCIISLDWDHTLHNMAGLDLNLLAIMAYAKAKQIPIGLTTHRDIENTTLYSLPYWQYEQTIDEATALAAAISYWDKNVWQSLGIQPDFINARYQPLYENTNYYQTILMPHEERLAHEISINKILQNSDILLVKAKEYVQSPEVDYADNEYKETQMRWLLAQYANLPITTIYHVDDHEPLCSNLPSNFNKLNQDKNVNIQTLHYQTVPFMANPAAAKLLQAIGLIEDINFLVNHSMHDSEVFMKNPLATLAVCLLLLPFCATETALLDKISKILIAVKPVVRENNQQLLAFCVKLTQHIRNTEQAIYLLPNNLYIQGERFF